MKLLAGILLSAGVIASGQSQSDLPREAVTALRSVVNSGTSYLEYSRRVLDARIAVDRGKPDESTSRALTFFELASQLWSGEIRGHAEGMLTANAVAEKIVKDEQLRSCSEITRILEKPTKTGERLDLRLYASLLTLRVTHETLWLCANSVLEISSRP